MLLEQFFDSGLGHASYLVADPDEGVAFLVDPDRHLSPYLERAAALGVLITHSFETHVHNDYVAGSPSLAALRPITVVTGADASVGYPHVSLGDRDHIDVGALRVACVATPGHTPEHVAFIVADLRRADGSLVATLVVADVTVPDWRFATPFQTVAADGVSELFGAMWLPSDFDPAKRYQVIDYIYPGPQGSGSEWQRRAQ